MIREKKRDMVIWSSIAADEREKKRELAVAPAAAAAILLHQLYNASIDRWKLPFFVI